MKPKDEEFKIQELFVDFKLCKLKTVSEGKEEFTS